MKRPADQNSCESKICSEHRSNLYYHNYNDVAKFYEKPEDKYEKEQGYAVLFTYVAIVLIAVFILTGCASTHPTIGECIDGRVTWSDGTTERCKILKQSGSI